MSQVLEILTSLGIDHTVYYQFGIFFITFISMKYIVFGPYLKAYDERVRRTVGGQEKAESLLSEAEQLEGEYKEQAKKLNSEIKQIFNESNQKAKKEVDEIIVEAKVQADRKVEAARQELEGSVSAARKEMESFIPAISENIQNKFMRQ